MFLKFLHFLMPLLLLFLQFRELLLNLLFLLAVVPPIVEEQLFSYTFVLLDKLLNGHFCSVL